MHEQMLIKISQIQQPTIELNVYAATIVWNGVERQVPVLALGRRPLLGTALLENCELLIQFVEGGLVTVDGL